MNSRTFKDFHDKYHDRLLWAMIAKVRNREIAEDLTSMAFARAFEHRRSFRGEASVYTWLYQIAMNEWHQRLRRSRGLTFESIDVSEVQEMSDSDLVMDRLERSEHCLRIRKILRQIPVAYRRVLRDHLIRGHSVRRISKREKVPLGTALSRLFKGKQLLREAWEG